ncbi:transcription factor BIM2 isoform X1 [Andrographis paniculata]|uniref:transcription factor BIM2 isoform X1 n=1 Tax=Andrographis paniculata TaxID=175694 RepID=UPI0021E77961|nr:transcription factor BIM2 isoform X1 [Andrographis paniculata]
MKSGKGHLEEEEEEDDEFGVRKDTTPSANSTKDGKNNDKASAMRSKHSVTEQRRRSKINERFQKLRELIPHSDQKRDTASFLFEVIQYVQLLQEKVQKYEGSYQPWGSEPMKLMPWRNSQWRVQSFVGQPQTMKNGSGPGASSPGRFDDRIAVATTMPHGQQNPIESDHLRDVPSRTIDLQTELPNKVTGVPMPLQTTMAVPIANNDAFSLTLHGQPSDPQSTNCPSAADNLNHQDELTIEGGTISISSVYSEELLNSLAQALESTGVDLSQARISVQINLGKRANQGSPTGISVPKEHAIPMPAGNEPVGNFHAANNSADLDRAQKRQKI